VTEGRDGTGKSLALYRQVAADLGREIGEGRYSSGGRLPADGEFAERYGVSRGTVRQAMALPRTEGLLASRRGTRRVVIGTPRGLLSARHRSSYAVPVPTPPVPQPLDAEGNLKGAISSIP